MTKPTGPVGVFVAVYESEDLADGALKEIESMSHDSLLLDVYDKAKIIRRGDGKVEVRPARGARSGAKRGMLAGAVIGLIFPPTILAAGAVGAAAGGGIGKLRSGTLSQGFLGDLGEALQPGRSAVVVVTDAQQLETVAESVPPPVRSVSQEFPTSDSDEIRSWLTSMAQRQGA